MLVLIWLLGMSNFGLLRSIVCVCIFKLRCVDTRANFVRNYCRRPYVKFCRIALSSNMTTQLPFQPDILAIVLSHWRTMQSDKNFCTTTIPHENRILCKLTLRSTYYVFQFLCKKKHKLLKSSSFCKSKVEFKFSKYIKFNQSS